MLGSNNQIECIIISIHNLTATYTYKHLMELKRNPVYLFYLFIQHLLSAPYKNKHALMTLWNFKNKNTLMSMLGTLRMTLLDLAEYLMKSVQLSSLTSLTSLTSAIHFYY